MEMPFIVGTEYLGYTRYALINIYFKELYFLFLRDTLSALKSPNVFKHHSKQHIFFKKKINNKIFVLKIKSNFKKYNKRENKKQSSMKL